MTTRRSRSRSGTTRRTRVWVAALALFGLLIAALLIPRYRSQIATVDETHRWPRQAAPPRREIVWQPAVPMATEANATRDADSQIRPQVSDDENVIYFTIRSTDNDYDIVRARRIDGGWSTAAVVSELNSDADDVGPVIRDDGQQLYFYSSRAGGFGGMDLYVSERDGDRWTTPANLGPKINSPVHEYDPAISPDGRHLYFSSNRNELSDSSQQDHWSTTLRADLGNRTFDLYVAELETKSNQWQQPTPLDWLNTHRHNEGAPFISPDGAFLFFVSDRPTQRSEAKNFDIYRARIDRADIAPENLGTGINTEANETEPALAAAGFRLHFSRSDADNPSKYSLYQSTAREIYHDRKWEASNWGAVIGSVFRRVFDQLWWILLLLAALAALYWLIREIKLRHIAVPGFLLLALLLHMMLVTGSFFVFFQQSIAERLRKLFEEDVVATQVLLSSTSPTKSDQPAFDQVADLEMPDLIKPADVSKQSFDAHAEPRPIELAKPQRIIGHTPLPADLPDDAVIASVPVRERPSQDQSPLQRAAITMVRPVEQVRLEQTVAARTAKVEPLVAETVEVERQEVTQNDEIVKPMAMEPVDRELLPDASESDELEPAEIAPQPVANPITVEFDRLVSERSIDSSMIDTPVPTETVAAVESQPISVPMPQSVEVDRAEDQRAPTLEHPEPLKLARRNESATKPSTSEPVVPIVTENNADGAPTSNPASSPLKRVRPPGLVVDLDSAASTETIKLVVDNSPPAPDPPTAKVQIPRQQMKLDAISVDTLLTKRDTSEIPMPPRGSESFAPVKLLARNVLSRRDRFAGGDLPRRQSKSVREYADTRVNLRSLLLRRKLDEATKVEVVKEFGGNDETLAAIRRGLAWIEQHQERDGHWSIRDFHKRCEGHKKCDGRGNSRSDTAGTGLALLPFLGDGNTHQEGPYKDIVARGITWLAKNQKPDGNLFTGGEGNAFMYSHGIATIALCECYGMTGDESLREPCQRAINFIVAAQDPKSGGWRYKPREQADTSVVGWQVMALKSAQMADLNVPPKTLEEAQRWLEHVAGDKNRVGQFSYQHNKNFNPAMTAEALLCLQYMDNPRDSDHLVRGAQHLLKNLPKKGRETSYYWYYGTQTMFHLQGDDWKRWNDAIHPLLVESQRKDGPMAGTWDPRDQWEKGGGRIYATSLRILMLEVYYRHLPIYQVIE